VAVHGKVPHETPTLALRDTQINVPNVMSVKAYANAKFMLRHHSVDIKQGRLAFRVMKQKPEDPVSVNTDEGLIHVVGTLFQVERHFEGLRKTTTVSVQEGVVEVTRLATHEQRTLRAAESWAIMEGEPLALSAMPPAPAPSEPAVAPPAASVAQIRSTLRAGKTQSAREMIRSARARTTLSSELAELALLECEVDLADGRYSAAIGHYLAVARKFPRGVKTDAAQFAAAQLAVSHPEAGYNGDLLLRQYLLDQPRGKFREDAQHLLSLRSPREKSEHHEPR
jgi:hypothetical protein